jgi:hypothetical protein
MNNLKKTLYILILLLIFTIIILSVFFYLKNLENREKKQNKNIKNINKIEKNKNIIVLKSLDNICNTKQKLMSRGENIAWCMDYK